MATAYVEENIAKDDISEKDLLLDEDKTKNTIIKNQNYKDSNTDSKTKKEEPKGEKEKEKGEKEKQRVEDEEEVELTDSSEPENDNYRFNLCGAGQCPPHFSCQDNERINNILQVR